MNSLFLHSNHKAAKVLAAIALIFCLFFNLLVVNLAVAEEALSDTQQQLDKISKIVQQIENKLAKSVKNHDVVDKEMGQLDREIGKLHHQIRDSKLNISNSQKQFQQLQTKKDQLDSALEEQAELFKQQIRIAYSARAQSKWKLLLSQNSLQHAGRNSVIYDYIHQARVEEIGKISQLAEKIRLNQAALRQQQDLLQNLIKKHSNTQLGLEEVRNQKQKAQAGLARTIEQHQTRLKQEKNNQKKLQKLLKKLTVKKSQGEFARTTGKLYWPAKGTLKHRFGDNRLGSTGLQWSGALIHASRGTDIHAIYPGTVVFSDWFDHYGWLIIIDHGDGYMSLYAHAEGLYKKVDDHVTQGELIAVMGDSGDVDQTSLYFEIRRQGTPVDPAKWCVQPKMAYSP